MAEQRGGLQLASNREWLEEDREHVWIFVKETCAHSGIRDEMISEAANQSFLRGQAAGRESPAKAPPAVRSAAGRRRSTQSRLRPRRRPWLYYGVIPLGAAAALLITFHIINGRQLQETERALSARVIDVGGSVEIIYAGGSEPATVNKMVGPGNTLRTGEGGYLRLRYLADRTTITLKSDTELTFKKSRNAKLLEALRTE